VTKARHVDLPSLLELVAAGRTPVPDAKPWDHGWCVSDYRHSADAAATGPGVPVRLSPAAVGALEEAMQELLRRDSVARSWDSDQLWGTVVSAVATLPFKLADAERVRRINERLEMILAPGPTFVAFELANVAWTGPPLVVGDAVIGLVGEAWFAAIKEHAKGRPVPPGDAFGPGRVQGSGLRRLDEREPLSRRGNR
jgi:hypothetical protein